MTQRFRSRPFRASLAALLLASGCTDHAGSVATTAPDLLDTSRTARAVLAQCPSSTTLSTSALIGPLGGVLAVGPARVLIPQNAVLLPTTFVLVVPAGQYMEFDVSTSTSEHYAFALPVVASIDYSRCPASVQTKALTVWNIDTRTKALLENMGGVDDKLLHVITFVTTHFSGYAVAD